MARKGLNIYKRKDGRWEGRYIKGRRPNGKAMYGFIYGRKYAEVKSRLLLIKAQYSTREKIILPEFQGILRDWMSYWIQDVVRPGVKSSTFASYYNKIQNHILPALGERRLDKLSHDDVQQFVNDLATKGLAPNSQRAVFRILSSALQKATDSRVIFLNPCHGVTLPQAGKARRCALSIREQEELERGALQEKNGVAIILALQTGMRIGEICALRWEDVDFTEASIYVRRTMGRIAVHSENEPKTKLIFDTPKTESSYRTIPLPTHLMEYLIKKKEEADSEYVISCRGSFAEPRVVNYRFQRQLKTLGLSPMCFHSLRHTFATRCIEKNIDIATLSRLLGHSSVKLTLDIYTDSMLEQQRKAMYLIDKLLIAADTSGAERRTEQRDALVHKLTLLIKQEISAIVY